MAEYIERDDFLKRIKPYNTSDINKYEVVGHIDLAKLILEI